MFPIGVFLNALPESIIKAAPLYMFFLNSLLSTIHFRTVASRLGEGYEWTKTSVAATRDTLHSAAVSYRRTDKQTDGRTERDLMKMVRLVQEVSRDMSSKLKSRLESLIFFVLKLSIIYTVYIVFCLNVFSFLIFNR